MLDTITPDSPIRGLAEELQRQLATKRDLVADTRRVSFSEIDAAAVPLDGGELLVDLEGGPQAFGVTRHAHGQIADHLGIQQKLYDRLLTKHPELHRGLVNGLLSREPSKRMLRLLDGNVRAFLSDRYRKRDNWDLLEKAVLPVLADHPGPVAFHRCELTDTRMYVKIKLPQFEKPISPKVGDAIHGGVIVQNSEVGSGALAIFPYTVKLDCLNGMVHTEYGKRHVHVGGRIGGDREDAWELYSDETLRLDDAAFFAKCRDALAAVLNETVFDAIVADMRDLAGIAINDAPDKVVELLSDRHRFTGDEAGSILGSLIDGGDRSAWGYVNAITATARDLDDPERRVELETLAGRLTTDREWATALTV